MYPLMKKFLIV